MREIAALLGISLRTVERHALHIHQKLDVSGRRELSLVLADTPEG
jgi:DNA-binding CsgD family transcriptional regulator